MRGLVLTLGLAVALGTACSGSEPAESEARPAAAGPGGLARAVTAKNLRGHLVALDRIARRSGGSREAGGQGYARSVAYVERQLRQAGLRPRHHSFAFDLFRETRAPLLEQLAPGSKRYRAGKDFVTMRYSGSGSVTGTIRPVRIDSPDSACDPADFDGFPSGAVALVRRGICFMSQKARNAKDAGAAAVLIANEGVPGRTAPILGTLVRPGIGIPVLGISSALGAELAPGGARVRVSVSAISRRAKTSNVVADLPGRSKDVVLLGAHLDSVAIGPGINDNGSGVALVLEVARQARRLGVRPRLGLRFAFWGAEELGLVGSNAYVAGLGAGARDRIAAVLNFDMVASRNFGRFVYDGDGEPEGSLRIENLFHAHFKERGLAVGVISIRGSSDHAPFSQAGIPVGGLFAGADARKEPGNARLFGGTAGRPYDPCYHQPCDTLANADVRVLEQMADAAAVVSLRLAG